ncbi:TerB family tellurite resistance protein [Cognatiyoonia sp. IB215446]|uniref:tellurite resistance TerB family protein n=1 Tax=Cognatiyoonia sp. IB215446 TaxID=3097355 RepID=UPI002A0F3DFF|nr:TerB family tellurite resistance protein [Cognatiyoonia sp. IB215446]MDX8346642.1 TerB family tellurite resistance protein [Cognatiyoonia sp. IB215446]
MLERLIAFFGNPAGYKTPLPEADAPHALGALLVRAAKADDAYLFEEIVVIDKILAKRHELNPVEAAKMRAECEVLEKEIPRTSDIAAILEHAISTAEKEATLLALWQVALVDGTIHTEEDTLLHRIEEVLGVPPERAKALQAQAQG